MLQISFHVDLGLEHVNVDYILLGVQEGVVHIDRVHGLQNW
jgi:hypothetical protein